MSVQALVREYRDSDRRQVLELFRLNTPAYFSAEEEKDLNHYLDQEIEQYFVLELDGQIIGCGGINFFEEEASARISWDFFHPDFQGKGLGTILLDHRIALLKANRDVQTIVVRTSQFAFKFYEKAGFKVIEKVENYWAEGFDLYHMEL